MKPDLERPATWIISLAGAGMVQLVLLYGLAVSCLRTVPLNPDPLHRISFTLTSPAPKPAPCPAIMAPVSPVPFPPAPAPAPFISPTGPPPRKVTRKSPAENPEPRVARPPLREAEAVTRPRSTQGETPAVLVPSPGSLVSTGQTSLPPSPPKASTGLPGLPPPSVPDDVENRIQTYIRSVAAELGTRKRYPPEARDRDLEGTPQVEFSIDEWGRPFAVKVTGRAHNLLEKAAADLVTHAHFAQPPAGWSTAARIEIPISYRLR